MHIHRSLKSIRLVAAALSTLCISWNVSSQVPPWMNDGNARLTLTSIYPRPSEVIGHQTVIEAELAYSIRDFVLNEYQVFAQVGTETEGVTTDWSYPAERYEFITQASGKARVSFPLRYVWLDPTVKHPPSVWFVMTRHDGTRTSKMVAIAGPIHYAEAK